MWFKKKKNTDNKNAIEFKTLNELKQLDEIIESSHKTSVAIFKHSTTCSISNMALGRMQKHSWSSDDFDVYYLDLLTYRPISNAIEEKLGVKHESPQLIILKNGEVVHHSSHNAIKPLTLEEYS